MPQPEEAPKKAQEPRGGVSPPPGAGKDAPGSKLGHPKRSYAPLPALDSRAEDVPRFERYFEAHIQEIRTIQLLLEEKLSDSPAVLDDQIRKAEAWHGRLTSIEAWANSYLDLAERRELVPRDSDYTDVDREIHLEATVSRERRFRDVVTGLRKSIEQRISFGQSMMKSWNREARPST